MEIVGLIIGLFSGLVLGYVGHIYQIKLGKLNIQRERLLSNIAKVEQYISLLLEYEYIDHKISQLENKSIKPQEIEKEILDWINKELKRIYKERDEKRKEKQQKIELIKENIHRLISNPDQYSGELDKYPRELNEAERELDTYNKQFYSDLDIAPQVTEKFYVSDIASHQYEENLKLELTINPQVSAEDKEALAILRKEMDNLYKQRLVSDIVATCLIVDRSGELLQYINELEATRDKDLNKHTEVEQTIRQSELRYKIRKFLDKKIN